MSLLDAPLWFGGPNTNSYTAVNIHPFSNTLVPSGLGAAVNKAKHFKQKHLESLEEEQEENKLTCELLLWLAWTVGAELWGWTLSSGNFQRTAPMELLWVAVPLSSSSSRLTPTGE